MNDATPTANWSTASDQLLISLKSFVNGKLMYLLNFLWHCLAVFLLTFQEHYNKWQRVVEIEIKEKKYQALRWARRKEERIETSHVGQKLYEVAFYFLNLYDFIR